MIRLLTCALAVSTLVSTLSPRSADAQESGLLLGLNVTSADGPDSYRTYWIAREKGEVRLIAEGPDLLVPRRSGFWRVCLVTGHDLSEGELHEWDSVVVGRASSKRGPCAASDSTSSEAAHDAARCTLSQRSRIMFAGTDAVGLEVHQEGNCGAHYSGGTDVTLTSFDDGREIDLSKLLEPTRRKALLSATLKAAHEAFADLGTVDTTDGEPSDEVTGAHFDLSHQWGVERGPGYWYTVGQASCWPYVACGDGSRTFLITDFSAPRAVVGHDELFPSLADVKTVLPGVIDAVSSPRRDLLVALSEDSLVVFDVNNGRLGVALLRLSVSGRIVMAQWAVGRFVPQWSAQLRQFLGAAR